MPWQTGGKVILYTDTPPLWLNWDHPRVRVVLHTEVYPKEEQADVLPVRGCGNRRPRLHSVLTRHAAADV